MIRRFEGKGGRRLLVSALTKQELVAGNNSLAERLAGAVALESVSPGSAVIEQGANDNDIFFILAGNFEIVVNGQVVATRSDCDHVGEMAAIEPSQPRSATVRATVDSVVARLSEEEFSEVGNEFPQLFRNVAVGLSRRLLQRNKLVAPARDKIRLFIICSAEALSIARIIQTQFQHDAFLTVLWTDGVFRVAHYPLESLEAAVNDSDFAVAIAHSDDMTTSRGKDWPSPRDNVIFELGLFMGRLGRQRAILMEPRDAALKLPSDLAGVMTIPYRFEPGADAAALLGPACNILRDHINRLGPRR